MAVLPCPECGGTVFELADRCPHCGFPTSHFVPGNDSPVPPAKVSGRESELAQEKVIGLQKGYAVLLSFHSLCFAGAVFAGIWLAISGEWVAIGYGLLGFFLCPYLLTIATIPLVAFGSLAGVGVTTVWCVGIFVFLGNQAGNPAVLALWSYGVACGWFHRRDKELEELEDQIDPELDVELGYRIGERFPSLMRIADRAPRLWNNPFWGIGCFALLCYFWLYKPSFDYSNEFVPPAFLFAGIQLIGIVAGYFLFRDASVRK